MEFMDMKTKAIIKQSLVYNRQVREQNDILLRRDRLKRASTPNIFGAPLNSGQHGLIGLQRQRRILAKI